MDVSKLFSFSGRIGRRTYWLAWLAYIVFVVGLASLMLLLGSINEALAQVVYWAGMIPVIWVSVAMTVKRWHDRGKSGKWVLIALIPIVGGIWALVETGFLAGDPGVNEYGAPESGSPFQGEDVVYQPV